MIAACAYYRPQLADWSVAVDANLAFV
jgi:hypothetical protein